MRAIVARRYGVLQCEDVAPPTPRDGEVLLAVRAAAVNPADRVFAAPWPALRLATGLRRPKDPRVGHDVAGVVASVGRAVTRFAPGDAVFGVCRGAFAEYACAAESMLTAKPSDVTFEQAAAVPVAGLTALQALRDRGRVRAGAEVLINGAAGGVGTFAVQIAKALGGRVTGVCGTPNVALVRCIGAEHVVDYTREDFASGGRRYDLIVDCVGNRPLRALRRVMRPGGTCVLVGAPRTVRGVLARVLGSVAMSRLGLGRFEFFVARVRADHLGELAALLAREVVVPVVGRRYALTDAGDAMRHLETGHARGKIVLTV